MLTIILGIAIIIFGAWVSYISGNFVKLAREIILLWLGIAIVGIGVFVTGIGIVEPLSGFEEAVIKEEINLMPIYVDDETGNEIYAVKASNGGYFVKYKENDEILLTVIECIVIEDETIDAPIKCLKE